MKLTLLLCCFFTVSISATVYSQSTKLSINVRNTSIKDVLQKIESETEFRFIYESGKVNMDKKISLKVRDMPVEDVLDRVFSNEKINYVITESNLILIDPYVDPNRTSPVVAQQGKRITGTVTDANGEPVIGANILEKGVTNGTVTDVDGKFNLEVSPGATLVVSYIGYVTQEITVGNQASLTITLQEDNQALEEVVVIGYGTQKKESLTSAITTVNTELMEGRSIPKMATALQGITPGVNVRQKVGRPGYSASVDIRGASMGTFSSNGALVLIDGVVGSIDDVNPNDVEHISILKDAAAAAIYGSRATGGVVLITTKRGTSGKTTVNYQGTFGVQQPMMLNWKDNLVDTQTWMRANNEALTNDGSAIAYTDDVIAQYDGSDPLKPARSQWLDFLNTTPMQHQHDVSVRGGTEKIQTYLSAGYLSQEGIIPNDDYGKYTFLGNLNWKPFKRLEISVNTFYSKEHTDRPVSGVAQMIRGMLNPPMTPVATPEGYFYTSVWENPVEDTQNGNTLYDVDIYRINADIKFELTKGLYLKYTIASRNVFDKNNAFYRKYDRYDTSGNYIATNRAYATASESWGNTQYLSHLISLDYAVKAGDHSLTAFAGFQTEENRYDGISASRNRFINNELRELSASVGSGTDFTGNSSAEEWAMASLIGRADYAYKDRYLLGLVVRYDGSSRFSPEHRWGLFPSVSAGWRIKEEAFMKDAGWLSNLKLRTSWGRLGNQGTALYPFATTVGRSSLAFGNSTETTTSVGTPADLNLSWETKTSTNVGLDFGFLNNRLLGSFDWFYDRTKDIIGTPTVSTTFGASAPVQNTYTIDNRGWELELKWMDRIGNLTYYIGGNISDFRDKVVSLGGLGSTDPRYDGGYIVFGGRSPLGYSTTYYAEGRARDGLFLYETDGLFVDQQEIDSYIKPSPQTKPGDIKFIDRNGDGQLNSADEYLSTKTTTPHYFYGFNFGAEYKGFDLSAVFSGVGERWAFRHLDGHYVTGLRPQTSLFISNYENRWTTENPDKWADQPRLTNNNWLNGDYCTFLGAPSEYHLRNFGYLRLKNLQIGYTIPKQLTEKFYVSKLRVFFTGENLFYYAPGYTEYVDPESNWSTTEDSNAGTVYYGPAKVFSGGVSITF